MKITKNWKTFLLLPIAAIALTNCHETVPAGTKGKIMGASGFQPEIYPPSKIWLSNNIWNVTSEKLYLVETTTKKFNEPVRVKLAKEKLDIGVEIVFRGRIAGTDSVVNSIFNDLKMDDNLVTVEEVYNVYGRQVVTNTARSVISKYNVEELPKNYERITVELYNAIKPKLQGLPIEISDVTIGTVDYPKVVERAIELATEKRMAIEEAEAKVQIKLTEAKGQEEVAKAQYNIRMLQAKQVKDYNKMISEGITEDLLKLKQIELQSQQLEKWNGIMPTTVLNGSNNIPVLLSMDPTKSVK